MSSEQWCFSLSYNLWILSLNWNFWIRSSSNLFYKLSVNDVIKFGFVTWSHFRLLQLIIGDRLSFAKFSFQYSLDLLTNVTSNSHFQVHLRTSSKLFHLLFACWSSWALTFISWRLFLVKSIKFHCLSFAQKRSCRSSSLSLLWSMLWITVQVSLIIHVKWNRFLNYN